MSSGCQCFTCKCYRAFQAGELTKHEYDCLILGYYFGKVSALKPIYEHFKNPTDVDDDTFSLEEYVKDSYLCESDGLESIRESVMKKYKKFVDGTSF